MAEKPRLKVPKEAKKGEIIEIKTLIPHVMESGQRKDKDGKTIPRKIINRFVCRYGGQVVFSVDLHEAISANPFIEFYLRATDSGRLDFVWEEDGGGVYRLVHELSVA